MIEINLLETKKPFKLPEILGVDLNIISIKAVVLAIILGFLPDFLFKPKWQADVKALDQQIQKRNKIFKGLNEQALGQESFKAQIEEFALQEKRLEAKLVIVKKIIERRKNPMSIMLYMTKNIPKDVWLKSLKIMGDDITISGESSSFPSISKFQTNLEKSVFFEDKLQSEAQTVSSEEKNRIEKFTFLGKIKRFD